MSTPDIEMIDPNPTPPPPSGSSASYASDPATPTQHKHHLESASRAGSELDEVYSSAEEGDEHEHEEGHEHEGEGEHEHEEEHGDVEGEGEHEDSPSSESESDSEDEPGAEGDEVEVDTTTGHIERASVPPPPAAPRSPKRMSIDLLVHPSPAPLPSTSTSPPLPSASASTAGKKPRSKRTPSPPPPPPPQPMQTIRLQITLGGPTNYEVDIARLARETGQRPPSPTPLGGISVVEKESAGEGEEEEGGKKKKKKKATTSEYYDISDPFIDDSELALDDRKWFAQTKQQGFYVSSGEVALLKDRTPKKPKSKKPLLPSSVSVSTSTSASASAAPNVKSKPTSPSLPPIVAGGGSVSAPPNLTLDEDDPRAGQKRKRYVTVVEGGKKRKVVDVNSFHPELQGGIEELKKAIANESWAQKGKFPPSLKPLLANLAMDAIRLDEYDEHFFNLMPTLFPYNKFTMMKLIKRTVFQDHINLLTERQDVLLAELTKLVKEGFAKAEEEYERAKIAWDKRQENTTTPREEMDMDDAPASASAAGGGGENHENKPPQKRYRLTDAMKGIVWQLVCLSNECCRLENEKNGLEGSVIQVSEQGGRKALYQKIVAAFPDGWMNSGQISRDVSVMKKKFEKEQMEET